MRLRAALISILLVATIAGAFILIDDTHDQTVGGTKTHVLPVIGSEICADLPVPPTNGELQYCSDCVMPSHPCVTGGTGAMAAYINGQWECFPGGNAVVLTATPAATATPEPTDTPLIDLAYSGKLNLGVQPSGTPLGNVAITADATPAPHDRVIYCDATSSNVTYTLPPATQTGRVIDMVMVDTTGGHTCTMSAGSDFMNDGHQEVFATKWKADTCQDASYTTAQWVCRNMGTPTPTPTPA